MEKLCQIRDIYRAIAAFEAQLEKTHNLCLNEGMLLCSLSDAGTLSSGEIADMLGLSNSNASKVIRSVEDKGLIKRVLGTKDKRQMYFSLTEKGKRNLSAIKCDKIEIPELLKNILEKEALVTD
ncbi:MarR family transcriptional regulator [Bacteroidaceae bacterium HV4-6-C5C]|jgi:Transcriptional regulators|nr:MarR family transcriptional regulator [Bacteroidaceae bacterium HV4-6-C5C]